MRALFLLVLLAGCSQPSDFAFKSAKVDLPADTVALPAGPGAELVTANCTACHSPEMILTQPRFAKPVWEAEVAKMIKVYKAPIAEADVPKIVDALVGMSERLPPG